MYAFSPNLGPTSVMCKVRFWYHLHPGQTLHFGVKRPDEAEYFLWTGNLEEEGDVVDEQVGVGCVAGQAFEYELKKSHS